MIKQRIRHLLYHQQHQQQQPTLMYNPFLSIQQQQSSSSSLSVSVFSSLLYNKRWLLCYNKNHCRKGFTVTTLNKRKRITQLPVSLIQQQKPLFFLQKHYNYHTISYLDETILSTRNQKWIQLCHRNNHIQREQQQQYSTMTTVTTAPYSGSLSTSSTTKETIETASMKKSLVGAAATDVSTFPGGRMDHHVRDYNSRRFLHSSSRSAAAGSTSNGGGYLNTTMDVVDWICLAPDVQYALENHEPIVALESTIVAHGMPYPHNLELVYEVENIIRKKGVIPATIAIKDGICRIGLTSEELNDLAQAGTNEPHRVQKCSTRDITVLLSKYRNQKQHQNPVTKQSDVASQWGATTVASTMVLAHTVGISTFVTGGIGGVHRDGHITLDISADLIQLSRTPVIVVSAGIKSILDIQRTLEVLETFSVPAIAYQCNEFPAFFSTSSGLKAPIRMDDVNEIASMYQFNQELQLSNGLLIAVPNPDPAAGGDLVEKAIQEAIHEANILQLQGRDVTPYILKEVANKTKGESLRSNMSLVKNNAIVGAEIAIAIAQQQRKQQKEKKGEPFFVHTPVAISRKTDDSDVRNTTMTVDMKDPSSHSSLEPLPTGGRVIVYGGVVLDMVAKPLETETLRLYTSNPSSCYESDGGVGRNIAEVLSRLGLIPFFYSVVGNDARGYGLRERVAKDYHIPNTDQTIRMIDHERSATYLAILNEHGDLHTACADMNIFQRFVPLTKHDFMVGGAGGTTSTCTAVEMLVLDANPPLHVLKDTANVAHELGIKIFMEPTSVSKAMIIGKDATFMSTLTYASPNLDELIAMSNEYHELHEVLERIEHSSDKKEMELSNYFPLVEYVFHRMNPNSTETCLIVTCGEQGVILATRGTDSETNHCIMEIIPPCTTTTTSVTPGSSTIIVNNATGAGDTLAGTFIYGIIQLRMTPRNAIDLGIRAATISLQYQEAAISPELSSHVLSTTK